MIDSNRIKSTTGIEVAVEYLTKKGYSNIQNLSEEKNRKEKGFDLKATKNNKDYKIEVKCSQREEGIPDCFNTEFDKNMKMTADILIIVRLKEDYSPKIIQVLTKEEVDSFSEKHREKRMIKLASELKNKLFNKEIGLTEEL